MLRIDVRSDEKTLNCINKLNINPSIHELLDSVFPRDFDFIHLIF